MTREEINKIIVDTLVKYSAKKIALFGSYARNEQTPESDIDLMVEFANESFSYFDLLDAEEELRNRLEKKIDLVPWGAIKNQRLLSYINKDLQIIYS